jgi:helix-turn-helix protein
MSSPLMDLTELAAFLKVSKRTAQDLAKDFPHFALGDRIKRYDQEEILAHLREQRTLKQQHLQDTAGLHPRKSPLKAEGQAEPTQTGRKN